MKKSSLINGFNTILRFLIVAYFFGPLCFTISARRLQQHVILPVAFTCTAQKFSPLPPITPPPQKIEDRALQHH